MKGSKKIRTAQELAASSYNYYLFFKINPAEQDVGKIEEALLREKRRWTMGTPIQRRFVELYDDVVNVMINDTGFDTSKNAYALPGARAKEAAAAKTLKLRDAVDTLGCIARCNRTLYRFQVDAVLSRNKEIEWFTETELMQALEELFCSGVRFEECAYPTVDGGLSVEADRFGLDFRSYSSFNSYMRFLFEKEDAYALLGLTPRASLSELVDAANGIYNKCGTNTFSKRIVMQNAVVCAKNALFATEEKRHAYDTYLAGKELVWDALAARAGGGVSVLLGEEYRKYAEMLETLLGVDTSTAKDMLAEGMRFYRLTVTG